MSELSVISLCKTERLHAGITNRLLAESAAVTAEQSVILQLIQQCIFVEAVLRLAERLAQIIPMSKT